MTYLMPSIVSDVSAMFVATTTCPPRSALASRVWGLGSRVWGLGSRSLRVRVDTSHMHTPAQHQPERNPAPAPPRRPPSPPA
eukprot:1811881-Rhodomonas_salina.1